MLAQLSALWLLFAALEVVLGALIPGTVLRSPQLSAASRLSLLCYDLAALIVFVLPMGAPLLLMKDLRRGDRIRGRPIRWLAHGVLWGLTWGVLLVYGASWASFRVVRQFANLDGLAFWSTQPVQVFHWIDPSLALGVPALALLAGTALSRWWPQWVAQWGAATERRFVVTVGAAAGSCVVGALLGELLHAHESAATIRPRVPYAVMRDDASGPFAHALADLRSRVWRRGTESATTGRIPITRRRRISMDEYRDAAAERTNGWNVIVLIVESLRADQLRAYGATRDVMPAVDALAREARVFVNAFAQASHTSYASPTPLSSHYPLRSAITHIYPENPSYPRVMIYDVLKALGYHTGLFSSSNEHWGYMINYLQTGNLDRFFHAETFDGPTYTMAGDRGFARWVQQTKHAGSVDDRFTMDRAIEWIDGLGDEPFFLGLNLQNSHLPYTVPPGFPRRFGPEKVDFGITFEFFPEEKVQIVKDLYADSLAYVDSQIARLLQHLRDRGQWERTVVVVTGDHGQAFYEHGFVAHAGPIFNEVMKVPLIIRAPGLRPAFDDRPAQQIDIPPSVLRLLGLPPHPSSQGINLFEDRADPNRAIYMVAHTPLAYQYGIVRSRFKLIYDERHELYALFDLALDPGEKFNLARFRPALVSELAERLHTWRKAQIDYYGDPRRHVWVYPPIVGD